MVINLSHLFEIGLIKLQALWFESSVTFSKIFNQISRSNEIYAGVNSVFHFVPSISFCIVATYLLSWLSEIWLVSAITLVLCWAERNPYYCQTLLTIVLNRGCHYQTTVKTQLVWLFCFTKLSILISSSLKYIVMAILSFVMYCFLISEHAVLGSKV